MAQGQGRPRKAAAAARGRRKRSDMHVRVPVHRPSRAATRHAQGGGCGHLHLRRRSLLRRCAAHAPLLPHHALSSREGPWRRGACCGRVRARVLRRRHRRRGVEAAQGAAAAALRASGAVSWPVAGGHDAAGVATRAGTHHVALQIARTGTCATAKYVTSASSGSFRRIIATAFFSKSS